MRNVLLITIDSLRADHVGCYNSDRDTTPTIDELATSGHRFSNAYAHSGTTRTSFPAILTSSHALMYGGYERISKERTLVSEVLAGAGYQTAGFHSNLFLSADFGYDRGFQTFYDSKSSPSMIARGRQFVKQNLNPDGFVYHLLKRAFEETEKRAGVEVGSAYVSADDLTDMAVAWVQDVTPDEPVFLWTHYMDVHHPYLPPAMHQRSFRQEPISDRRATQLRRKMLEEPAEITDDELNDLIDLYDAEIRFTDAQIGRLVENAREQLVGDLVVIVTADHGEEFADHGGFSHNTVHDEGIHVPLIIQDNDGTGTYDELVGLLDVAPTIVDYAGQNNPDSYQGFSLRTLIGGGHWPRTAVIGNWGDTGPKRSRYFYRDHEWKYIRWPDEEELYNLRTDPEERCNAIAEYPHVARRLRKQIDKHEAEVAATHRDLGDVVIDDSVKERLEMLGYTDQ